MRSLPTAISTLLGTLIILTTVSGAAPAAAPAILNELPADSQAVLITTPLTELSAKVDLFARTIGIAPETPVNIEEMLGTALGIPGMIDGSRGVALAIGSANLTMAQQTMIAYIPVRDAAATIAALTAAGATPAPGVEGVVATSAGIFAMPAGKILLLAGNPEILAATKGKAKGFKLSPTDKDIFASADVALTANLTGTLPMLQGMLMMQLMSNPEMQKHPSFMTIAQMALARLNELEAITFAGKIVSDGVNVDLSLRAQPGTALASFLSNHPTADLSLLKPLPNTAFLQANVVSLDMKAILKPIYAILDTLAADATFTPNVDQQDPNVNKQDLQQFKTLLAKVYGKVGPMAFAAYPYTGPSPPPISVSSMANMDDILKLIEQICPLATKVIGQFGYTVPITYTAAAGKVDGLSYDEISLDIGQLPLPPQIMQAIAVGFGGKTVVTTQYCKIKKDVYASGLGIDAITQAVAITKTKPAGLNSDPGITRAAKNLPAKANVFMFNNVGQSFAQNLATNPQMAMMAPMFAQLKGTVGTSVTMTKGTCSMRTYIPTELVQGGVMMFRQFMAMMMPPTMQQPTQPAPAPSPVPAPAP